VPLFSGKKVRGKNVTTPQPDVTQSEEENFLIGKPPRSESIMQAVTFTCTTFSLLVTFGILFVLISQSALIFSNEHFSIREFLTGTVWQPASGEFGALPLILATFITSIIAMCVFIPLGLGSAIYMSEIATKRQRAILKPIIELLATIPTIVYGFFALLTVSPLIRGIFGSEYVQHQNMLTAGLVLGIMILPTVATMSEDAFKAVPYSIREASYGLGATKFETAIRAVFPSALSGIASACIIGFGRAIGETMIVALAAGSGPNFTVNPFDAAETITGHIVRISGGEISYGSVEYESVYLLGFALFILSFLLQLASQYLTKKYREVYQ
jgi:phosphate transport system permease protein